MISQAGKLNMMIYKINNKNSNDIACVSNILEWKRIYPQEICNIRKRLYIQARGNIIIQFITKLYKKYMSENENFEKKVFKYKIDKMLWSYIKMLKLKN